MTVKTTLLAFTLGTLGAIAPTMVATANPVVEAETTAGTNDSFATREMLPAGTTHVLGSLVIGADLEASDYQFSGQLAPDEADFYTIPNLPPNQPFYAWTDNSNSGIDTVMGTFNGDQLLQVDDDGAPVGNGLASAVGGTVNPDGTIRIGVSGFPDFSFDGMADPPPSFPGDPLPSSNFTPQGGDYSVYLQLGTSSPMDIDVETADYTFAETLIPGNVDVITLDDLPAGESFVVWIDNSDSGVDTMLGWFDATGDMVDFNDDGSPLGNGLGSILVGEVADDGSLEFRVTLFPDFDFTGEYTGRMPEMPSFEPRPHGVAGEYDLYVKLGIDSLPGDVDFYTFPGLQPGSEFVAEVTLANFDPMLGWFDDQGQLITVDDDGGEGVYPRLVGTVPSSGQVTLAVTSFADFEFDGSHQAVSDYVLRFDAPTR